MFKKDDVFGQVFEQMDKAFEHADKAFDQLDKAFDSDFFKSTKEVVKQILSFAGPFPAFPPINVYSVTFTGIDPTTFKALETPLVQYNIEIALSGYKSEDVTVNVHDVAGVKVLVIESKGRSDKQKGIEWYQRGIAGRAFKTNFTLANNVKVNNAELKDGLLAITLSIENPIKKPTVENIVVNKG